MKVYVLYIRFIPTTVSKTGKFSVAIPIDTLEVKKDKTQSILA